MLKLSSSSAFGRMASLRIFSTGTKANQAQRILGRYSDQFPYELARVQTGINVQLREFEEQKRLQSFSYDLQFQKDGKVHPILDDEFIGALNVLDNGKELIDRSGMNRTEWMLPPTSYLHSFSRGR